MKLKIALLQILPGRSIEEQFTIGKRACKRAKAMGADIALFPEMWSSGYYIPQDEKAINELSISAKDDFVQGFRALAADLEMAIGIISLEKHEPKPLNSIILFDRKGQEVLHYSKVHICAFGDEKMLSEGEDFYVADLDIGEDIVKVGSMICFDREFPESTRILMLKGAEVVLAPNACPMEINRLCALRTRAYENKIAIATCNYPIGQPDCNGHSTVFDGVAWLRDEPGVRDMCILEAPEEEGIYIAEIDMDLLRDYREHEVMGEKYRHPEKYGVITEKYTSGKHDFIVCTLRKALVKSFLGKMVSIKIDRPMGSRHPRHPEMIYPVNYGFIPNVYSGDGAELDVYLLGVDVPVREYTASVIGIIYREDDVEDKLVAAPNGIHFSKEEIQAAVNFQEQFFKYTIEVL